MATTFTKQVLQDSNRHAIIKFVGNTDTNVTSTLLLDAGSLAYAMNVNNHIMTSGTDRRPKYGITIKRIFGQGQFKSGGHMLLTWQDASNSAIVTIGNGSFDYNLDLQGSIGVIGFANTDPKANCTGNVRVSTVDVALGDSVTLFVSVKKEGSDYDQGQTRDPAAFNAAGIP